MGTWWQLLLANLKLEANSFFQIHHTLMNNPLQIPPSEGVRKVAAGEGEHIDLAGLRFTWKAKCADTGYDFGIYELPLNPGDGVPLHAHPYGEVFYILEGRVDYMRFTEGQLEWVSCERGDTLVIPPNALHGFANRTQSPARVLSTANQLHQAYFDEAARVVSASDPQPTLDMEELQQALALGPKYHMFFPPPPAEASASNE
jgi:quercetin dioxygenase-like cupin family protein